MKILQVCCDYSSNSSQLSFNLSISSGLYPTCCKLIVLSLEIAVLLLEIHELIIIVFFLDSQSTASSTPPYPVVPNVMTASTDSLRQQMIKHVRVMHNYDAQHDDELTIRSGRKHNEISKIFLFCVFFC